MSVVILDLHFMVHFIAFWDPSFRGIHTEQTILWLRTTYRRAAAAALPVGGGHHQDPLFLVHVFFH
jgi:hypothetical protein